MLDGRKLFNMYVERGLPTEALVWEELTPYMQSRWNMLARRINTLVKEEA